MRRFADNNNLLLILICHFPIHNFACMHAFRIYINSSKQDKKCMLDREDKWMGISQNVAC